MPDYSVYFHPSASEEAEIARGWYAERSDMAARTFILELAHAVDMIVESPHRWPKYQEKTRRYIFPRYPFSVVYRIVGGVIEIIAIAHHRKKPGYWTS